MSGIRCGIVLVAALILCVVVARPVRAQTQTGTINGTVRDPNGDALPGATVTVSGPSVMGVKTSVTGAEGDFRVPTLLPGDDYRVEFTLDGFQTVVHEGIRVSVGVTTTLSVAMQLSARADEIVVSGRSPIVDITSPTSSTTFDLALLANVPNSRYWADTVMQSPGVVNGSETGYGSMYVARGGSVVANEVAFDGVANTNPVYHHAGQPMVYEAVDEIQVVRGAMPAELGNVAGAYVNLVTKSGGNEFHGDAGYYYQDQSLQSDNLNDELRAAGISKPATLTDHDDYSFNVGGPILRDTVWFNVAYWRAKALYEVIGFPHSNGTTGDSYFGKVTWQPSSNHRVFAMYERTDSGEPYDDADRFHAVETTKIQDNVLEVAKLDWTWLLSDDLFLNANASTASTDSRWYPQPGAGVAYGDLLTGMHTGGPYNTQFNGTSRDQANASLAYFKDGWGGNHDFKFGLQWEASEFYWDNYREGTPLGEAWTYGGFPYYVVFYNIPDGGRINTVQQMDGLHGFAQDSWGVSDRVTLSLGLRVNTWKGKYPKQGNPGYQYGPNVYFAPISVPATTIADFSSIEPRLGATIALDDEGKTALRIGLNRYHHSMNISTILLANPNSLTLSGNFWSDLNGDLFPDPNEVSAPFVLAGGAANTIDPGLNPSYTDEITVGFERELFTDFSITVNASWRKDHDLISDIDVGTTDESFVPVTVPDPGPDGEFGTADDQELTVFNQIADFQTELLIQNTDLAKRKYKGVEVIATKRMSHRWQALASVVWGEGTGTLGQDIFSSRGWDDGLDNPNDLINLGGPLSLDREWQVKLIGTYLAPLGFSVSGYYQYQTGVPLYRVYSFTGAGQGAFSVTADPWDRHRLDDYSRLDLRAEKTFSVGQRPWEFSLMVDVFNVFNENNVTVRYSGSGIYNLTSGAYSPGPYEFWTPIAVQPPRTVRLGARLRF